MGNSWSNSLAKIPVPVWIAAGLVLLAGLVVGLLAAGGVFEKVAPHPVEPTPPLHPTPTPIPVGECHPAQRWRA